MLQGKKIFAGVRGALLAGLCIVSVAAVLGIILAGCTSPEDPLGEPKPFSTAQDAATDQETASGQDAAAGQNTSGEQNTAADSTSGSKGTATISAFSVTVSEGVSAEGVIDQAARSITVAVPYFEGIDTGNLSINVTAEDGAAVQPASSGPVDLSKPKTFQATAKDGTATAYTVTAFVLFEGYESLADLKAYTSLEKGITTKATPYYIALSGFDLSQMVEGQDSHNGPSTKVEAATYIFGCIYDNAAQIDVNEEGFTNNQFLALDLSRCTGSSLYGPYITSHDGMTPGPFAKVVSIIFPEKIVQLGSCLFEAGVIEEVKFPPYLVEVSYKAFANATSLKSVEIPGSLKKIGEGVFKNTALTSVELPNGLTTLGAEAFADSKITGTLTLPASVTSLGMGVFKGTNIRIADFSQLGITELPLSSFLNCGSLEAVYLPGSVYQISSADYTFMGLSAHKFRTLVVNSIIPPYILSSSWDPNQGEPVLSDYPNLTIYVPDVSIDDYKEDGSHVNNGDVQQWRGWGVYADKIKGISQYK
jgi:hypothetical protein